MNYVFQVQNGLHRATIIVGKCLVYFLVLLFKHIDLCWNKPDGTLQVITFSLPNNRQAGHVKFQTSNSYFLFDACDKNMYILKLNPFFVSWANANAEFNNVWGFSSLTEDCRSIALVTLLSFINCDMCSIYDMSAASDSWYGQRSSHFKTRNATCALSVSACHQFMSFWLHNHRLHAAESLLRN
jgi:hypothetical protein